MYKAKHSRIHRTGLSIESGIIMMYIDFEEKKPQPSTQLEMERIPGE